MRELLFRAWDYDDKKLLYFGGIFNRQPYTETSTFVQYESCPKYHRLSDIEMWTGLIDKNGLRIYEGDILQNAKTGRKMGTVVFEKIGYDSSWNGMTGFAIKESYQSYDGGFYQLDFSDDFSEVEVCGNIHEKEGD